MSSYKNFQVDRNKSKNQVDIFKKGKSNRKQADKSDKLMEGVAIWGSFYRANPHRFVKDFLGIELKMFQQILLYAMMHFNFLTYIASRGQGKTFLTAIFCVTRAILFAETKIIAAAGQKNQGMEIIQKIQEIKMNSPLLEREITDIKTSINDPRVNFRNGSWIRVVAANDGARGARSNLLIVDEYRLVPSEIIETVLKKFQSSPRRPKFLDKPEYKDDPRYIERNKQIFLSSAWFKAHESYDRVVSYQENMTDGKSYFVCALPYQLAIKEGLLIREEVEDDMSEKTFNKITFEMEMHALFWGSGLSSYFTFDEIQKNRKVNRVYYPRNISDYLSSKSARVPKLEKDELRVVSADIATMAGSENDASIFTVGRLIPTKDGYDRQIIYMESMEGGHTTAQSMRIRQLFQDFECTHIVLDTQNAGIGIYDQLTEHATDPQYGTEYTPLSCMNDSKLADRCAFPNAPQVVYSIRGSAQLNSNIASNFKDSLGRGRIKFPVLEGEAVDTLNSIPGYKNLPEEVKADFLLPYIQTTLMANEILNLEYEVNEAGLIRLKEMAGNRKDRYSSVSYLDWFATEMSLKNRKNTTTTDIKKLFRFRQGKLM